MQGAARADGASDGLGGDERRTLAYLILTGLGVLFVAMVIVAVTSIGAGDDATSAASKRQAELAKLPPYWTVRRGDTYVRIAQKTGLTVEELETFNPYVDPATLVPGQRLKLRKRVPPPKPKPKGPKWVKLRPGDSFGSVAAKTGKSIDRLRRLNPKLKAESLQPGDRVRVR
ncbi:MAG TPA: LysM peptidoglycan-binding domain-containing protein [Solirubrobacteraceae bacterium]|nr:LysM peptidoglycan-binding domain-containing protein [Solirubrobacteraceae bacterium]